MDSSTTIKTCAACGEVLVQPPPSETVREVGAYRVTVRGTLKKDCPRGCPQDFPATNFTGRSMVLLVSRLRNTVARRRGIFRKVSVCRACGELLGPEVPWHAFSLPLELGAAGPGEVIIEGPALPCYRCGTAFLPADGRAAPLGPALAEAVTGGAHSA